SRVSRFRYAVIDNPPNPELRWEQVGTSNIAIDFASKNNRVTGSVEFYRKKGTDLISYVPIDPTMGFGGMAMNVGSLRSQGIDVRLNSLNTTGVVSWRSNVYFSSNKDKVLKIFYEREYASQYIGNGTVLTAIEGKPAYPVVSYAWAGLDPQTGDPRGYVGNEISTDYRAIMNGKAEDLTFHGNGSPQHHGAMENTITYKGFSLSVHLTWRL